MIYLDTNILIYAIENHPVYGKACGKIMEDIESERLKAGASVLVLVEVLSVLNKINRLLKEEGKKQLDLRKNIEAILSLPIVWFDLNFMVIKRSSEYSYDVSGVDYVHVATMDLNSISEVISADEELDKIKPIRRIDPRET